ncbi:PDZ domain-containing protein [Luteimonas sp. RD2P54]|uniref:PDZ domain-containing protein n=1 Tax=Luteimonas endophytica TaxID=3042023 RepID=A0ABT6J8M8_9GAMM|nr:PDZ domain-containing protein [Luteimonas endophytica]MDH5822950.1 PDZ domain-containing protein [Luteimonas endophytica]
MTRFPFNRCALAVALAVFAGAAWAQDGSDRDALAEARAELARAAARVAELSENSVAGQARIAELRERLAGRPVLGVVLAADAEAGVRIAGVTPGSAADEAGLRSGDRLVSVDGTRILGSSGELRAANARKLLGRLSAETPVRIGYQRDGRVVNVAVTPRTERTVAVLRGTDIDMAEVVRAAQAGASEGLDLAAAAMRDIQMPDIAAEVRAALAQSGLDSDCEGEACAPPMLLSAFRWHGLNLAEVDPQLGRYFGAERGVLVLSADGLDGLQPGDVIQRIDGREVGTPREAMAALRDQPADARVEVGYLRDRKPATTRITVPELRALRIPVPPAPPRPPAPGAAGNPPPAPAAPPAPPAPPRTSAGIAPTTTSA